MKKNSTVGISLIGKVRKMNEDSFIFTSNPSRANQIAIVADGIGGSKHGDIASRLTCELFYTQWELKQAYKIKSHKKMNDFLMETLTLVNKNIHDCNMLSDELKNSPMGSTIVLLAVMERYMIVLHVGDSRCYELTMNGKLILHTKDHTLYEKVKENKKFMIDNIDKSEYANILTKAVGIRDEIQSSSSLTKIIKKNPHSRYLLCSDGLSHLVPDERLKDLIFHSHNNESALNKLVSAAYIAGADDNLTMILI